MTKLVAAVFGVALVLFVAALVLLIVAAEIEISQSTEAANPFGYTGLGLGAGSLVVGAIGCAILLWESV